LAALDQAETIEQPTDSAPRDPCMSLPELLCACHSLGVQLSLQLVVTAPAGGLDDEHMAALRAHRAALLVHLAREAQWITLRDQRWGPGVHDREPGVVIDGPNHGDEAKHTITLSADPHEAVRTIVERFREGADEFVLEQAIAMYTGFGPPSPEALGPYMDPNEVARRLSEWWWPDSVAWLVRLASERLARGRKAPVGEKATDEVCR
jgi:hypothetical protein